MGMLKNSRPQKVEIFKIFDAESAVRLSPYKDDKLKRLEFNRFKAYCVQVLLHYQRCITRHIANIYICFQRKCRSAQSPVYFFIYTAHRIKLSTTDVTFKSCCFRMFPYKSFCLKNFISMFFYGYIKQLNKYSCFIIFLQIHKLFYQILLF